MCVALAQGAYSAALLQQVGSVKYRLKCSVLNQFNARWDEERSVGWITVLYVQCRREKIICGQQKLPSDPGADLSYGSYTAIQLHTAKNNSQIGPGLCQHFGTDPVIQLRTSQTALEQPWAGLTEPIR